MDINQAAQQTPNLGSFTPKKRGSANFFGKFTRVPKGFMEGVRLIPHNFNMPEKPVHGDIVHDQLREDLFLTAYTKIKFLENENLKEDDDYFRLKSIEKTSCGVKGIFDKFLQSNSRTSEVSKSMSFQCILMDFGVYLLDS